MHATGVSIESDFEVAATKIPLVHQLATCHATAVAPSHHPKPWQQDLRSDLSKNPGSVLRQSQSKMTHNIHQGFAILTNDSSHEVEGAGIPLSSPGRARRRRACIAGRASTWQQGSSSSCTLTNTLLVCYHNLAWTEDGALMKQLLHPQHI